MKVTARQDREPIVDGILSGWKEVNLHLIFSGIILVVEVNSFYLFIFLVLLFLEGISFWSTKDESLFTDPNFHLTNFILSEVWIEGKVFLSSQRGC